MFFPKPKRSTMASVYLCIAAAKDRAAETGRIYFVVEVDHEEGRRLTICDERFVCSDEFEAFDGAIKAIVNPDGSYEFGR